MTKKHRMGIKGALVAGVMVATPLTAASCAALPSAGTILSSIGTSLVEQAIEAVICQGQPLNVCLGLG